MRNIQRTQVSMQGVLEFKVTPSMEGRRVSILFPISSLLCRWSSLNPDLITKVLGMREVNHLGGCDHGD
jgi:hypothetical protein